MHTVKLINSFQYSGMPAAVTPILIGAIVLAVSVLPTAAATETARTTAKATATNRFTPRVHYTPPCYLSAPPHDIAAAIWGDGMWHVFVGCWKKGGWQHLVSRDLLSWEPLGKPTAFAGTGGLVFDSSDGNSDGSTDSSTDSSGGESGAAKTLVAYAGTLETWIGSGTNYTTGSNKRELLVEVINSVEVLERSLIPLTIIAKGDTLRY